MPELETANDRIEAICQKIRLETLDPAKEEAFQIIEQAKHEANTIRQKAKDEADKMLRDQQKYLEDEKRIFLASLEQASKLTIETLKQKITTSLFNPALDTWVQEELGDEKDIAKLVEVIIKAIEKEGLSTNLAIKVGQAYTPNAIVKAISRNIIERLKSETVEVGDMPAGVQIVLKDKHMMLDFSNKVLETIVASFVQKEFRKIFFTT